MRGICRRFPPATSRPRSHPWPIDPEQPSGPAEGGLRGRAQLCRQCRARTAHAACRGHRAGAAAAVGDGGRAAAARAAEIEATLKRLTRLSERLMQLARAEGGAAAAGSTRRTFAGSSRGRGRGHRPAGPAGPDHADAFPNRPVMSDLDPDAFGILCPQPRRERAPSRSGYGAGRRDAGRRRDVPRRQRRAGRAAGNSRRLTDRFERGGAQHGRQRPRPRHRRAPSRSGSEASSSLRSPRPGAADGFEASILLPAGDARPPHGL